MEEGCGEHHKNQKMERLIKISLQSMDRMWDIPFFISYNFNSEGSECCCRELLSMLNICRGFHDERR